MAKIDLVTIIHPEDIVHRPKQKYTFYAPANSGISEGDYVLVNTSNKSETLAKVVSVLNNIDEESDTMSYIRSISSLGDKKIKPVLAKLEPKYFSKNALDSIIGQEALDDYLNNKTKSKVQEIYSRKERLKNSIEIGTVYYSIEQGLNRDKGFFLYAEEHTYCGCEADNFRIEKENMFFDEDEANAIVQILMENVDTSKTIDIHAELSRIL